MLNDGIETQAQLCASTGDQDYEYSAPKFIDLSTVNAGSVLDDDASSNDDHWFERVHPLHESRRPRKPLRSLLTGCALPDTAPKCFQTRNFR